MKKFVIQVILLFVVIIISMITFFKPTNLSFWPGGRGGGSLTQGVLKIGSNSLNVEIAEKPNTRATGLGGRTELAADSGMLFILEKAGRPKFWMKNVSIPLDYIYINDNRVVDVLTNVPAAPANTPDDKLAVYEPIVDASWVVEVNAGYALAKDVRIGDVVDLSRK